MQQIGRTHFILATFGQIIAVLCDFYSVEHFPCKLKRKFQQSQQCDSTFTIVHCLDETVMFTLVLAE
ncbi:hypothetical protein IGI04_009712 [Brassica rapa subsp. trilocularis]|uniref:Secreted protein n=1 Tax=Brassica rapa subsp. trilocularis TaxID=1813537 RepID=A0ABQ7MY24_BRACM|nr:hypothetical protein IGI04_009712 [Brassica rapa subsp. trilocularis]